MMNAYLGGTVMLCPHCQHPIEIKFCPFCKKPLSPEQLDLGLQPLAAVADQLSVAPPELEAANLPPGVEELDALFDPHSIMNDVAHEVGLQFGRQNCESPLFKLDLSGDAGINRGTNNITVNINLGADYRAFSGMKRLDPTPSQTSTSQRTLAVYVALTDRILEFRPDQGDSWPESPSSYKLPVSELGDLRSITPAVLDNSLFLLIGAVRGAVMFDQKQRLITGFYPFPSNVRVTTAINAIAVAEERLFATHSQLGVVWWAIGERAPCKRLEFPQFDYGSRVRGITVTGPQELMFSSDHRLIALDLNGSPTIKYVYECPETDCALKGFAVSDADIYATSQTGDLFQWERGVSGKGRLVRRFAYQVDSLLRVGDRLVVGGGCQVSVAAVTKGQNDVVYPSIDHRVSSATYAPDFIIALSGSHRNLMVWRTDQGFQPPLFQVNLRHEHEHQGQDLTVILCPET